MRLRIAHKFKGDLSFSVRVRHTKHAFVHFIAKGFENNRFAMAKAFFN